MNIPTKSKFWAIAALMIITAVSASAALTPPAWSGGAGTAYSEWNGPYGYTPGTPLNVNDTLESNSGVSSTITIASLGTPPSYPSPSAMITSSGSFYVGGYTGNTIHIASPLSYGFQVATVLLQMDGAITGYTQAPILINGSNSYTATHVDADNGIWTWLFDEPTFDHFTIVTSFNSHSTVTNFGLSVADSVQAVPEPSTYALLGCFGLLGLVAVRRFRRK